MDQMLFDNLFENANQMQISEIAPNAQQERKSTFLSGSEGSARVQAQAPLLWQHIQETEGWPLSLCFLTCARNIFQDIYNDFKEKQKLTQIVEVDSALISLTLQPFSMEQ